MTLRTDAPSRQSVGAPMQPVVRVEQPLRRDVVVGALVAARRARARLPRAEGLARRARHPVLVPGGDAVLPDARQVDRGPRRVLREPEPRRAVRAGAPRLRGRNRPAEPRPAPAACCSSEARPRPSTSSSCSPFRWRRPPPTSSSGCSASRGPAAVVCCAALRARAVPLRARRGQPLPVRVLGRAARRLPRPGDARRRPAVPAAGRRERAARLRVLADADDGRVLRRRRVHRHLLRGVHAAAPRGRDADRARRQGRPGRGRRRRDLPGADPRGACSCT